MPIVILIPFFLCLAALFRDSVQKAFLNIYLPVFMLFPIYYYWKVASLPPIDLSEAVLLPIGMGILLREMPRWRLSTMDLWVGLFIFTSYYSDYLHDHNVASIFDLFACLCVAVIPYTAGKVLIEQHGARIATVKRIVFLLFVASLIGTYEYRMGSNPYTLVWARFFPGESFAWKTQIRWGWGRVSGPYGQSELAGMMLFFGLVLTLWLTYNKLWEPKFSRAKWLPLSKSTIIVWTIGLVLLMTQARGPWIGSIIAVPIALIGRTRRVLRATVILGLLGTIGGGLMYVGLQHYISGPTTSSEQEDAQYRQHLLDNYKPIAAAGGPWGYGQDFPRVPGQGSIDNEYLFVALTQGWVGLLAFVLLAGQTLVKMIAAAIYSSTKRDRYFAFSLLGVFLGLLITIFTVYLGNQPYELFFLLAGWAQALRPKREALPMPVFQQVYT